MSTVIAFHFPHKTASMFAYRILKEIHSQTGIPLFSQNNTPPNHSGIKEGTTLACNKICLRGPVRNFRIVPNIPDDKPEKYRFFTPEILLENVSYKAVCQTRDILDLIVSQYFSHGWIHPPAPSFLSIREEIQAGKISVYDYAIMEIEGRSRFGQDSIIKKMRYLTDLRKRLGEDNIICVEYEQMMLDFDMWASRIESFLLEYIPNIGRIIEACRPKYEPAPDKVEFFPDPLEYVRERRCELQHIRSPFPGDHLRFLNQEEINSLRLRLA